MSVCFKVLFPTLWSPYLRSGTASLSPACSAKQCWITCTRTKLTGAAYDALTHLQTCKAAPKLRSLKEKLERDRTSLNLPPVSRGVSSSFINGGKEYFQLPCCVLQGVCSHSLLSTALKVGALDESLAWIREKWVPLLEQRIVALQE